MVGIPSGYIPGHLSKPLLPLCNAAIDVAYRPSIPILQLTFRLSPSAQGITVLDPADRHQLPQMRPAETELVTNTDWSFCPTVGLNRLIIRPIAHL
jgi:hypothetical protein